MDNSFIDIYDTRTPMIITFTTTGPSEDVDFPQRNAESYEGYIDWGDGAGWEVITGTDHPNWYHTYASAGDHDVMVKGEMAWLYVNNTHSSKLQIKEIKQWGNDVTWTLYNFFGASNMTVTAQDAPNFINTTSIANMFRSCTSITTIPGIEDWDFNNGNAINMSSAFAYLPTFNSDLGNWYTNEVTTMAGMFNNCTLFNQDLSSWNTAKVTAMDSMFTSCVNYNQPMTNWSSEELTNISNMFNGCTNFNQDLNHWTTPKLINCFQAFRTCTSLNRNFDNWNISSAIGIGAMFYGCTVFNGNVDNWDVGEVTSMAGTFQNCIAFNRDVSGYRPSKCTSFFNTFSGCTIFNQDLNSWTFPTTGNVSMSGMFASCPAFNGNITSWDVSRTNIFTSMFHSCTNFNQNITGWTTSNATLMNSMFVNCTSFTQQLNTWSTGNVTNMSGMFQGCVAFNGDISGWDVTSCTRFDSMFSGCDIFNADIGNWTLNTAGGINMGYMMAGCDAMTQDLNSWDMTKVTNIQAIIYQGTVNPVCDQWDLSHITNFSYICYGNITFNGGLGVTNWGFENATTFYRMEMVLTTANYDAVILHLDTTTLNTSGVTFNTDGQSNYTGTIGETGNVDSLTTNKLVDNDASFLTSGVAINDIVRRTANEYARVTAIDSDTQLSLNNDIFTVTNQFYQILTSNVAKAKERVINTDGWLFSDAGPI